MSFRVVSSKFKICNFFSVFVHFAFKLPSFWDSLKDHPLVWDCGTAKDNQLSLSFFFSFFKKPKATWKMQVKKRSSQWAVIKETAGKNPKENSGFAGILTKILTGRVTTNWITKQHVSLQCRRFILPHPYPSPYFWPSTAPLVQISFSPQPSVAIKIKDGGH